MKDLVLSVDPTAIIEASYSTETTGVKRPGRGGEIRKIVNEIAPRKLYLRGAILIWGTRPLSIIGQRFRYDSLEYYQNRVIHMTPPSHYEQNRMSREGIT